MNPTNDVLEKRLAALDGGAAGLAFASGQAAITASLLTIVHAGQNFISANEPLRRHLDAVHADVQAKLGIEVRFFDPAPAREIAADSWTRTRARSTWKRRATRRTTCPITGGSPTWRTATACR